MTTVIVIAAAAAVVAVTIVSAVVIVRRSRNDTPVPADLTGALERLTGMIDGRVGALSEVQEAIRRGVEGLYGSAGRRGRWGELTVRRLLEAAGMVKGVDFDEQVHLGGEAIPDVVVELGHGGKVIIDAKAPMDALVRAGDADDDGARAAGLKEHAAAVKRHANELARRDYPSRVEASFAPVIMFLPVEGAWEAAEGGRPDIVAEVLGLGLYPASPATIGLVVELLRHQLLTLEQDRTAAAIVEEARQLVGRVNTHVDHLCKLGRGLEAASGAYNKAVGNLERMVLPSARRLADMTPGTRPPASIDAVASAPQTERVEALQGDEAA